jgi:hypothetical protein
MRLILDKRGTDKPIEIFVALFIILAVAMVILQMFSGQISAKTKELKSIEQSTTLKREFGDAKQFCQEKCTYALENDCNDMMRAQFCITYIENGLDMNGDGIVKDEYNQALLGGLGVCEDRVYCPQLTDCTCKQQLTMSRCLGLLCEYWTVQKLSPTQRDQALNSYMAPGSCKPEVTGHELHWFNLVDAQYKNGNQLKCPTTP